MSMILLLLVLAAAALFIAWSGQSMPSTVASHFGPAGVADRFMPREAYLRLMGIFSIAVPLFIALCSNLLRILPVRMINLPHRDYWLAAKRKEETFAFFHNHGIVFSVITAAFLCFVHWSVTRANRLVPPHLSMSYLCTAMGFFVFVLIIWIGVLIAHFSRRS